MAKKVHEVMTTDPQTASPATSVRSAAELMQREDVGSLPIVDDGGSLVGIVTDRDIVVRVVAAGGNVDQVRVGEILTDSLVPVYPDDDLDYAVELMAKNQVRRLPVVYDSRLVGMLAQADVAQEAKDKRAGQLLEAISQDQPHS
jgi:CBS domain-containing protein